MPVVRMPDGTMVNMPDQISPDQAAALRALTQQTQTQQEQGRGFWGNVSDFGDAAAHHLMSGLHGGAQLIENGMAKAADFVDPNYSSKNLSSVVTGQPKRSRWNQAFQNIVDSDNKALQQWEADYQKSVPNSPGAYAGAAVGEIAPFLVGGGSVAKGLQAAGDSAGNIAAKVVPNAAPKFVKNAVPKVASGATQGAILGAVQPVTKTGDYWDNKVGQIGASAAIGGAVPAVAQAANAAYSGVKNAIAPLVNPESVVAPTLEKWAGGNAGNLSNPAQLVPGSIPTTAQMIQNPDIIQAEKALLRTNPEYATQFAERANENAAARMGYLSQFGGDDAALLAAKNARTAAVSPQIDALLTNGNPVPVNGVLNQLNGLKNSAMAERPTIANATNDLIERITANAKVDPNTGVVTYPAAHLDALRQNLKDYLAKYETNGIVGSQQAAAMEPVRSAIIDAIEGANPGYRNYLADYAKKSQPINTMETVNSILDAAGNRALNSGGGSELTLNAINTALRKADKQTYPISDQARNALEAIRDDLQRASVSNSIRAPGSDTAYNLQAPGWLGRQLYGQNFEGGKLLPTVAGGLAGLATLEHGGGMMGAAGAAGAAGMGAKKLADFASKRVNDVLAKALLDPQYAQQLLSSGSARIPSNAASQLLQRVPQANLILGNALARQSAPIPQAAIPTP